MKSNKNFQENFLLNRKTCVFILSIIQKARENYFKENIQLEEPSKNRLEKIKAQVEQYKIRIEIIYKSQKIINEKTKQLQQAKKIVLKVKLLNIYRFLLGI